MVSCFEMNDCDKNLLCRKCEANSYCPFVSAQVMFNCELGAEMNCRNCYAEDCSLRKETTVILNAKNQGENGGEANIIKKYTFDNVKERLKELQYSDEDIEDAINCLKNGGQPKNSNMCITFIKPQ